jgi:hypothetical protein
MSSIKRSALEAPGICEHVAQAVAEGVGVETEIGDGGDHDQASEDGRPDYQPARWVPFKRTHTVAGRTRQHCKVSEPPGRQPNGGEEREDEYGPEGGPKSERAGQRGGERRPMAPPEPRDHDR